MPGPGITATGTNLDMREKRSEKDMLNYIVLSATACLMGFFPLFEIYLAVPAAMGLGLDVYSSVFWSWCGNFFVIPFIFYSYVWLSKINKLNRYLTKLSNSRSCKKLSNGGFFLILIGTPIFGPWTVGVVGKIIGMDIKQLFLASGLSIAIYGVIIGAFAHFGIKILQ